MDAATAEAQLAFIEETAPALMKPGAREPLDLVKARYQNLTESIGWFVQQQRFDDALRTANAMYRYWIGTREFEEGERWFDRVLDTGQGDEDLRGRAYVNAGMMPFWLGKDERAKYLFDEGLRIARERGDQGLASRALGGLSRVALRTDVAEGRRLAQEALEASDSVDDEPGRSNALHLLGVGAQMAGDLSDARNWMQQRLEIVRRDKEDFLIASEAANLSMVERQLGHLDTAEELDREALVVSGRIGDEFVKPFAIAGLAAVETERAHYERAAVLLGAAEAIMEEHAMAWPPDEKPHYDHMLEFLPNAMGAEVFDAARAKGHALSAEATVAFAMSDLTQPQQ